MPTAAATTPVSAYGVLTTAKAWTVESFVNEVNGVSLEERQQRINDVAYS